MSRPRWEPPPLAEIEKLASQGLTEEQIAAVLGISTDTIRRRKKDYAGFSEAIKKGRAKGIEAVANALFEAAAAGNVTAQIFYLKCRAGWKEAKTGKGDDDLSPEDLAMKICFTVREIEALHGED